MRRICQAIATPIATLVFIIQFYGVETIGCFQCKSVGGSNRKCEDTFEGHTVKSTGGIRFYERYCQAQVKNGLFPAQYCFKFVAYADGDPTKTNVTIRGCGKEPPGEGYKEWHSQCNLLQTIEFEERKYRGCYTTCTYDGCNSSPPVTALISTFLLLSAFF